MASELRERYTVHYTSPAQCAAQLATGHADLGLVPIGALPGLPNVAAVPGCTIASLGEVRSIQLVVKPGLRLDQIRTLSADMASRSSVAYVRILLQLRGAQDPVCLHAPASLPGMLQTADAALLIGDPALLALQSRDNGGDGSFDDHTWIDVANLWHQSTGLPWVAAVWAVNPRALERTATAPGQLAQDLVQSRDAGLAHVDTLVHDWQSRIALTPESIRTYLTENIHYQLDSECLRAVERFYELGAETAVLAPYRLRLLAT